MAHSVYVLVGSQVFYLRDTAVVVFDFCQTCNMAVVGTP